MIAESFHFNRTSSTSTDMFDSELNSNGHVLLIILDLKARK